MSPSRRGKISRACLDGQGGLCRHLHGDRVPASSGHALLRIAQDIAVTELFEDLRERPNRRVAKPRPVRVAAGARRGLADEVDLAGVGRSTPCTDAVLIEVTVGAD